MKYCVTVLNKSINDNKDFNNNTNNDNAEEKTWEVAAATALCLTQHIDDWFLQSVDQYSTNNALHLPLGTRLKKVKLGYFMRYS